MTVYLLFNVNDHALIRNRLVLGYVFLCLKLSIQAPYSVNLTVQKTHRRTKTRRVVHNFDY